MKKLALILLLSLRCFGPQAQAQAFYSLPTPLPNTLVRVCPVPSGGNPCPSPSAIFNDSGLSQSLSNPYQVGASGNFGFWIAAGQYTIQIGQPYNEVYVITLGGGGGTLTAGAIQNAVQPGIYATGYGVVGEGHFKYDATWTASSAIVTCPDCNFTTNATVGQVVYGTNLTPGGGSGTVTKVVQLPQTTIASIDSATQIHITSSTGITSNAGSGFLVWGTDETTQIGNAFAAAVTACSTLRLPGQNPENTGPAVMLVSGSVLSTTSQNCQGTGGTYTGVSVIGENVNASIFMIEPSFNPATCTFGTSGHACFLAGPDGFNFQNFQINGSGISNPGSGFASVVGVEMSLLNAAYMSDVFMTAWGGNSSNGIPTGFQMDGGGIQLRRVASDAFGQMPCREVSSSHFGPVLAEQLVCIDGQFGDLAINDNGNSPFLSHNGVYAWAASLNGNVANVEVASFGAGGTVAQFFSTGDEIGDPSGAATENGIQVGQAYNGSVSTQGGGAAHVSNDNIIANYSNAALWIASTTQPASLYIDNTQVNNLGAGTILSQYGGGTTPAVVYWGDNNTITTAGTFAAFTAPVQMRAPGHSLSGACTGTATSSSTLGLYGTGPNETTTTCTSTTIGSGVVMQAPGTLAMLVANAGTAGFAAGSGVVTVLKNGSTTALTCTFGTTTACSDGTHSVAYVVGDLISLQFTTQATETLANVKVSVVQF